MKKKNILILLNLIIHIYNISCFKTIDEAFKYISAFHEYPCTCRYPDLNEIYFDKPKDYAKYYQKISKGWLGKLLNKLNLKKPDKYISNFIDLLIKTVEPKLNKNYQHTIKRTISKPLRIIVIGSLYGEAHSFIRDLLELKKRNIIDNNFILKENTLLIINGNAINYGFYSLEILSLILHLMQKNREQFIYISGQEEYKSYSNGALRQELTVRLNLDLEKPNKTTKLIDNFFLHLPLTFLLKMNESASVIRFSAFEINNQMILDSLLASGNQENIDTLNNWLINTKAIIRGKGNPSLYETDNGLYKTKLANNIIEWVIFSSPLKRYRLKYDFFYDAFAEISINKHANDATITLYYNDLRSNCGFTQGKTFNLLSGIEIMPTTSKMDKQELPNLAYEKKHNNSTQNINTINIGSSIELTGRRAIFLGEQFQNGILIPLLKNNQERSDNNPYINITILDNGDNALQVHKGLKNLLEFYNTNILLCPTGSFSLIVGEKFIKENKLFVFFPQSGSIDFRKTDLTNIVHFRASYETEGKAIANHIIDVFKAKKIAFIYQNNDIGLQPLAGAKKILKAANIEPVIEIEYKLGINISDVQVDQLKKAQPEVIALLLKGDVAVELIKKIGLEFLSKIKLFATSAINDTNTLFYLKYRGIPIIKTSVIPNPQTSEIELVKEYREDFLKAGLNTSYYSLEAYISTNIALDILNKVKYPVTIEKLVEYIKTIKNYNFKGFNLNFNPKTHEINDLVWINENDQKWIAQKTI